LTSLDDGAVAALRALASKIDNWDAVVESATEQQSEGQKLPVPLHDNTSIPTFLKYCEALKLTPASRGVTVGESDAKGKLAQMRLVRGGKNDAAEGTG
jgi:hypothetical protein